MLSFWLMLFIIKLYSRKNIFNYPSITFLLWLLAWFLSFNGKVNMWETKEFLYNSLEKHTVRIADRVKNIFL